MKISVFITSYNQRGFLKEAIDSVLAQTLPPAQVIVVDDASGDGSQDLIADYARRYPGLFTPIYHRTNTGVAQVRVDALNAVRGAYVTYVDGDDRYLPQKLEKEAAALAGHPEARIAFSNNAYMTTDGTRHLRRWIDDETPPQGEVFWQTFARAFPKRSLFRMELVEYDAWKKVGFHDTHLSIYEDFDMRIRLTKHLQVVYVDEVLTEIRTHDTGLSKSRRRRHFEALCYLYRKNLPLLDDLSPDVRARARAMLAGWIVPVGRGAAKEALAGWHLAAAARMWRECTRLTRHVRA